MKDSLRLIASIILLLSLSWGCNSADADAPVPIGNCRYVGEVCGAGLICQTNDSTALECLPDGIDAGFGDGGASASADVGATGPCDGQTDGHVLLTGTIPLVSLVTIVSRRGSRRALCRCVAMAPRSMR